MGKVGEGRAGQVEAEAEAKTRSTPTHSLWGCGAVPRVQLFLFSAAHQHTGAAYLPGGRPLTQSEVREVSMRVAGSRGGWMERIEWVMMWNPKRE